MIKKSKSQSKLSSSVQIFSQLVEMKFKPLNQNGSESLKKMKNRSKDPYVDVYDPVSMVLFSDRSIEEQQSRRLRFIVNISPDHFIIGNQNQIDMISFGGISHRFVDTEYFWSLRMKGPIENIIVDSKKGIFFILSENVLYFYRYNLKSKEEPTSFNNFPIKEGIRYVRILKDGLLGLFYLHHYEIYNIQNLALIKKKLQKNYSQTKNKSLYYIPQAIDNIINVFFQQAKENKQSFILWCIEINFQGQQIFQKEPFRVYDVMNYSKGKLSIYSYTKDIIFMNLKSQIMAVKNGYFIDVVVITANQDGQILKYLHPETILHITKKNVEVYKISINMAVKPQKIILKSVDSISVFNIPNDAVYLNMLQTTINNFSIFFEDSQKKKFQTKGEISYYFKVSQSTTLKEKINSIFDGVTSYISNPNLVEEKYNMAKKMGLSEKQVYLEIWNRSNRNSIEDYQFILSTKDYKTIKNQIQNKLKKESMILRELFKIEEGCFLINKEKIEKPNCLEEHFQEYTTCFLLLKKYKLFKQLAFVQRNTILYSEQTEKTQGSNVLKMDIQQYYYYKNMDLKAFLIEQISQMLFDLKDHAKSIRITIKHFKFIYRLIYQEIIEEIIIASKEELIHLLDEIPEILPYLHTDLNEDELSQNLYDGIWGDIHPQEWQDEIIPETISNINNKEVLRDFLESIWFKRYWLTSHNLANKNKDQIIEINRYNNSQKLFYFFIAKLYEHYKDNKAYYYQVIAFLQERYNFFPAHLRNKTLLYENLYNYYYHQEKNNPKRLNFAEFLEYDDDKLFFYFFDHEKIKKNCLLREIKPIYQQSDRHGFGIDIFNVGLFSYFYSDLSKISDLKFILNRINNEKQEFHRKNFGIHEVLVKSIQIKMHLGSPLDIPIDEVIIYIKNIPIYQTQNASAAEITYELQIMENIKNQAKRFTQMRINMSLKEIMDECDLVLNKIFEFQIKKRGICSLTDYTKFKENTISLLNQVKEIKKKIYPRNKTNILLVLYLSNILKKDQSIDKIAHLLHDEDFHNIEEYLIDEMTIENIVLYLYKWKFSQDAHYKANYEYLMKILDLLASDNQCKVFLECSLELAILLNSQENPIQYPLSKSSVCPAIKDIHQFLKMMKNEELLALDADKIHSLLNKLQTIAYKDTPQQKYMTTLHKINEIIAIQLLNHNLFKEVIPYIFKILNLESSIPNFGIVYVIIFIFRISKELNEESRKYLLNLIAFYFYQPIELMKIIDYSIKTKLTGLQHSRYLKDILEEARKTKSNFNANNPIFSQFFRNSSSNQNSNIIIEEFRHHFKEKKEQLQRKIQYDIIYTILCLQPYFLAKFIDTELYSLNLKTIKGYLAMIASKSIFHPVRMFEVLKRIFAILCINRKQNIEINHLIDKFMQESLSQEYVPAKFSKAEGINAKIYKLVRFFEKQYKYYHNLYTSQSKAKISQERLKKLQNMLEKPAIITNQSLQLQESDVQKYEQKLYLKPTPRQKVGAIYFNFIKERNKILKREVPFKQFILGKDFLVQAIAIRQQYEEDVKNTVCRKKTKNNHLQIRKTMVERLHSHKVIVASDVNDDSIYRKENEKFLDAFVPHNGFTDSGIQHSLNIATLQLNRELIEQGVHLEIKKENEKIIIRPNQNQAKASSPVKKKEFIYQKLQMKSPKLQPRSSENKQLNKMQSNSYQDELLILKEELLKTYNQSKIPKFQLSALAGLLKKFHQSPNESEEEGQISQKTKNKERFLYHLIQLLYNEPIQTIQITLKLIEQVARKFPQCGVNVFFLQAYGRIYDTHQKYALNLQISSLLPISGLFIKSKDIHELYMQIQPCVVTKINDENIFKLSKLIALGFRKNVVEQELLCRYCVNLMLDYMTVKEEDQPQMFEKIKSIWIKITIQMLADKGYDMFSQLPDQPRREILFGNYYEFLKNKGHGKAGRQIGSRLKEE